MSARRTVVVVAGVLLAGAALYWVLRPAGTPPASEPANTAGSPPGSVTLPPSPPPQNLPPPPPLDPSRPQRPVTSSGIASGITERSHLADKLNAAEGTIEQDLHIMDEVFGAWRTNFPSQGNPVGTNAEITAAISGKNRHGFAFVPPEHPAINASGELCDRWGTPFFFHQISGTRMEVVSAGPDRKPNTADDVRFIPEAAPSVLR